MTMDLGKRLGDHVKALRKQRYRADGDRWTQEYLAQQAGISTSTVARLEQGKTVQSQRAVLAKIAEALGTSVDAMLTSAYAVEPPVTEAPALAPASADHEDLEALIYRTFRGDPRKIADFRVQAEGLSEPEQRLLLQHIGWAYDRIEATRHWEARRRAVVEADLTSREPRRELANHHAGF